MKRPKIPFKLPYLRICVYCESDLADSWDHIIPLSKGGPTLLTNLVPACRLCNSLGSSIVFENFEEKRLYIRYRLTLKKRPKQRLFGMTTRIIQPSTKIIIPEFKRITLATLIKDKKTHFLMPRAPRYSPPIYVDSAPLNQWLPATVDNALLLMLGSSKTNQKNELMVSGGDFKMPLEHVRKPVV